MVPARQRNVTLPFISASNTRVSNPRTSSHPHFFLRKLNFEHVWASEALGDALGGVPHWEVGGDIVVLLIAEVVALSSNGDCGATLVGLFGGDVGDYHLRRHLPPWVPF